MDRMRVVIVHEAFSIYARPEFALEKSQEAYSARMSASMVGRQTRLSTTIRISEVLGLKWMDIDWKALQMEVTRSVVDGIVGKCKTETSRRPVPIDEFTAGELLAWKCETCYAASDDWVFASERVQGRMPPWADTLLDRFLQPAAKRAGITKWVGFHTFRHTYSTLLKANGEDVKVVQELMRHANISTTMNIYTKALTPAKREAQSRVVDVLLDRSRKAAEGAA
jgi:integrase